MNKIAIYNMYITDILQNKARKETETRTNITTCSKFHIDTLMV